MRAASYKSIRLPLISAQSIFNENVYASFKQVDRLFPVIDIRLIFEKTSQFCVGLFLNTWDAFGLFHF